MVYYWNKDYFEGLKQIGETYSQRPGFELFGLYCLEKEKGLKKVANKTSLKFIDFVNNLTVTEQREIILHICELNHAHPDVHSLLNHHISKLITDVLKRWTEEAQNSIKAFRWYVFYCGYEKAEEILSRALEINPNDQMLLMKRINKALYDLEYMVHHLNENFLIGEPKTAKALILVIKEHFFRIQSTEAKAKIKTELSYFERLFLLWEEYNSQHQSLYFVKWAEKHKEFKW